MERTAALNQSSGKNLLGEAIHLFRDWYEEAASVSPWEPSAMTLATADLSGRVTVRTVLLKEVDESGFVFYTNRNSTKGRQLGENPRAALCFLWREVRQQIIVEGTVESVDDAESDAYWGSRSRRSQLGAWASRQSQPLRDWQTLLDALAKYEQQFQGKPIPRPDYWGGYRVIPDLIEFWRAGDNRLNHRERFWKDVGGWQYGLIFP